MKLVALEKSGIVLFMYGDIAHIEGKRWSWKKQVWIWWAGGEKEPGGWAKWTDKECDGGGLGSREIGPAHEANRLEFLLVTGQEFWEPREVYEEKKKVL